ncbi:cytochrome c [uncultured Sulfitobacter sp.]|uniref:c-type cytochrome n=1 Tax=uncultured Sulfitobacter sp. TaxID=191468 RepID=UPI002609EBA9|nr:cytochrome c [uncultured Sulfitobacter sp.]
MKFANIKSLTVLLTVGAVSTASFAASHESKSSNAAVNARHAQMQMVSYSIGLLGAVAKGEMDYSAEMVSSAAKNLQALARMDKASLWIAGTEQGAVDGSRAKAEIWSDPDGFAATFKQMDDAATALIDAADAGAVGAGMGALGGACKACHEKYRGPKN